MTRKVRVPIFGTAPAKGVMIDADATQGATIGANVYNPDGSLFVPAATPAPGQTYPVTVWQRIMYVPPNVVALEKAVGAGLFAVTGPATGAFREITAGDGIDVSDGDGVAGDPIVAHADTSNVTDVSTSNTGGVFIQNLAFTFDQFGHVTGVTVDSQTVQHNDTGGIQGGAPGDYVHLTQDQLDALLTQTLTATWNYNTSTTMADPGAGNVRTNAATAAASTAIAFDSVTLSGLDASAVMVTLKSGNTIYAQTEASASNWARFRVTGDAVDNSGWVQVPVVFVDGAGTVNKNDDIIVRFGIGGGAASVVHNDTVGLQGGTAGEYFHLTAAQYAALGVHPDHNDLTGLQGGDVSNRWHMTASQQVTVNSLDSIGSGIAVRTGASTWTNRYMGTGTGYTWTNPSGVAGNPTLVLSANLQAWSGIAPATKGNVDAQTWTGAHVFTGSVEVNAGATTAIGIGVAPNATDATVILHRGGTYVSPGSGVIFYMTNFAGGAARMALAASNTAPVDVVFGDSDSFDRGKIRYRNANDDMQFHVAGGNRWEISATELRPAADNSYTFGTAARRPSVVYAVSGTINTSDEREKTPLRDMTPAEISCAVELTSLPCVYKWLEAVEEKGDSARLHISPGVQSVIAVMERHGLDPFAYGFICYDKWDEQPEQRDSETGEVTQPYRPAGDRYSLRPSELEAFRARGLAEALKTEREERLALEARIAALEA